MAFEDYDVGLAFARIEDELIASMMRNLKRHLQEEEKEGFDWSQWQVEQLKYLQEYRQRNRKKFGPQFADINRKMKEAIQEAYENGQKEEELQILESIAGNKKMQRRYANQHASIEAAGDAFFRPNEKKLEALMDATQNDMQKAEQAVLRRSNDQYRKIIFDAQMYANTGAATIEKAVDMATKDFLSRGIDSIVYKNGSRHTISDYADMYIRTAERRATLMGEGRKRQEWGESLVIVNKRGGHPCPKCLEWVGKILIDDVYSGGKPDGKHKLLSEAMAEGLYHPRCKDGHTTYIPGVTSIPDPVTQKEEKEAAKAETEEQREQLAERQEEKFTRLAENSLDPENKRVYEARAEKWHEQSTGMSVKTEKERIQELNKKTSETVLDNYETRRVQQGLNMTPADQLRELYAARGNNGSVGYVDFSGLSVQTAETVSGTIEKLSQDYVSGLTHIRTGTAEEFFGDDSFAFVQHNDRLGEHELLLNPRKMKNYDRMCERIRKLSDDGKIAYIPEGLEGEYIATHEFAHGFLQVQRDVRKDWIGQNLKHINHTRKEIRDLYEDYLNEVKLLEEEVARLEADPDFLSDDIEKQMAALERYGEAVDRLNAVKISDYSMENADEFMAEAFTQNRIGVSRSKYSDRVMEVLDREYRIDNKDIGAQAKILNRAKSIRTEEQLMRLSRSAIININNIEDIQLYFMYHYDIEVQDFIGQDLFKTKTVLAGYDDFMSSFPEVRDFIKNIMYSPQLEESIMGTMDEFGFSKVGSSGLGDYGTGLHEAAHALDYLLSSVFGKRISKEVVSEVQNKLGKSYLENIIQVIGLFDDPVEQTKILADPIEIFAYAMETKMGGVKNTVADEIFNALMRYYNDYHTGSY